MVNYVVAIPTYNRSDVITSKTLNTLKEGNVDRKRIFLFVANKEEERKYMEKVPKTLYNEIIVGKIGITKQRIFISQHFKEGQYIVSIDDDVEELLILKGSDKLIKIKDIDDFFVSSYERLKREKLYIWGIYPVRNPFFMKKTVTTDLKFIIGVLFGYINRHSKKLYPSTKIEVKEDYEMSILYYLMDGGIIRYNYITPKTKFYSTGGLGNDNDRITMNQTAAEYLKMKYPELVTIFHRKNGMPEVKLTKMQRIEE
jgi:hypothetical protein